MDPRIGKADYGERYRKLYQTELSDNAANHDLNSITRQVHRLASDANCNKANHLNEQNGEKKPRNYRLITDPALQPGAKKVYSINGVIPGVNELITVRDPRHRSSKFYFRRDPADLPVPSFKHDQHSVSSVLPKEVTFLNLNNNIDKSFLMNLCCPFGNIDNVTIYYHPVTKKHLGIGSVLFSSTKAAKLCCEKLHNTSSMGNIMNVFVDIAGVERKKVIEDMTTQKTQKIQPITLPPFKSPSQNKIHKISSHGNMMELYSTPQQRSESSTNLQMHCDGFSSIIQNGLTSVDLPTPSYSDMGYFSSRHSETSEQVLSSGGESVGSGNSSIILPADPRLSRSKESAKVVSDSPLCSDELLTSTLSLNSPFTPDHCKSKQDCNPSSTNMFLGNLLGKSNFPKAPFSSPSIVAEVELDQIQNRDPRLTRAKDCHAGSSKVAIDRTPLPKVSSSYNILHADVFADTTLQETSDHNGNTSELLNKSLEDKLEMPSLSLESRIEAMLNQETSFGIPRSTSFSLAPILDDTFGLADAAPELGEEQRAGDSQTNECVDDDDDDRMSMSSCDEPKNDLIEVNVPAKNPQINKPPPPVIPQWAMFSFQFPVGIPVMPPFVPTYPRFYSTFDIPDIPPSLQEDETTIKFRKVLGAVVTELKTVLSKDLRRKMVESTAFEVFDEWWNKNDLLDKKCGSGLFSHKSVGVSNHMSGQPINDASSSMLNFLFEGQDSQNRMGFGSGGLLGLRGIAAKLPSFRKKYRAPTPPPVETDENESRRITCASDSESDEEKDAHDAANEESRQVKFRTGSDDESQSSDGSGSDDDDDEEDDDDVDVRRKGRSSQLILSDSDSEESGSESGGTAMASDESDDELTGQMEDENDECQIYMLKGERESLKRRRNSVVSSDDGDSEAVLSKKVKHDAGFSVVSADSSQSKLFDEENEVKNKKRKRISEESDSKEKPSKLQRSDESENRSTPAVPNSESHTSCRLFFPSQTSSGPSHPKAFKVEQNPAHSLSQEVKLSDVTNRIAVDAKSPQRLKPSRELLRLQSSFTSTAKSLVKSDVTFPPRDYEMEAKIVHSFSAEGIDLEDIAYLKESYEQLILADYPQTNWLNETHWFDHPPTDIPPAPPIRNRKKRLTEETESKHKTGSARTEGYYKISLHEKSRYLQSAMGVQNHMSVSNPNEAESNLAAITGMKKKVQQQSRDARSESRRWQSFFSSIGEDLGDLLKFNQLKFRKKQLKFAKSGIHDWGLFALERIQEGEMVIEYVGQVIRQSIADIREKRYESLGIGSSYLFRIDGDTIVDATKYGNLARFINHSCTPNCCAKIVTVESQKKIVIYSRRDIEANEEITYDYKFPLEDQKIPCLCGSSGCRGSLN